MKLVDANILLYAVNEDAPLHDRARPWLEAVLSGTEPVAMAWTVLLAFLRLSTRPAIFVRPLELEECFEVIRSWLDQPCVTVVHPTERHAAIMKQLLLPFGTAGNLTGDAHLAALALEYGAELCSCDGDFGRFPGLRWHNPLA
ncbi:MAG: type II toxin-antitoxin system VapC family toxin [Acidobacteria bacterium]|nr:type II toxin-antitoxin system VapC family toxin [Acidobacteriota bacterium]